MPVKSLWLLFAGFILQSSAVANVETNTEGWYQVEVIVFANNSTTDTDEVWPLTTRQYPNSMITIGPRSIENLRPSTLGQLEDLERYLALWDETSAATQTEEANSDFLFESRRSSTRPPVPKPEPTEVIEGEETLASDSEPEIDFNLLFETEAPVAFKDLPRADRIINSAARSIRRSSMYTLLYHNSWLQPVLTEDKAIPVLIQGGKRYDSNYELDGTVTISRSRFLHISTDLWLTRFSPLIGDSLQNDAVTSRLMSPLDGRLAISPELRRNYPEVADWLSNREQYIPVHSHHLEQSRRMRSSTLHFIDHPQFGVLVRIERFEPEAS